MRAMDTPTTPVAPAVTERASPAKLIKWAIAAVVVLAILIAGIYFWRQSQLYVSTDNAYVNANRIEMAAQVSGPVTAIHVQDQQAVQRGEVLFEIDPQPYQLAVDAAEAQLELAYQASSQDRAAVAAARALVTQRTAELTQCAVERETRAWSSPNRSSSPSKAAETVRDRSAHGRRRGQRRAGQSASRH